MSLIRGNALSIPLASDSVDLIVTSPPYFALRSYTDGGEHYDGQIGSEATPADFIAALVEVTRECVRVLKPSGSLWVNLGDKYAGGGGGDNTSLANSEKYLTERKAGYGRADAGQKKSFGGVRTKSLIGLPWRYGLACIDDLGLILRAEVIWCLSGGARVYAEIDGKPRPMMLRDLVRSYQPEKVRLWNGGKWTQVLGWNRSPDTDGAHELELRSGERIGCTPGHQWPTRRGLLRADEIRVGDVLDTTSLPDADRTPAGLSDEDIGWFVGLYLAEGSRSETMIQFAGHINETARHARLARIAADYDGSCSVYQTGDNAATCNLSGSVLSGILDRYVSPGTAKTKRLTRHAWARSNAFLAAVVDGYLEGDGHYDAKNDRYRLGFTANDEWAADLRTLAARLDARLTLKRTVHRGNYGDFPGWRGEWRWTQSAHHSTKSRSEVVAIRASRARQFFDVGVADEPHLFALASGVLTHNSKPNGLPESVTDRVRRSHEQWFHFTKEPRYYSAVDEIREPYDAPTATRSNPGMNGDRNDGGGNPLNAVDSMNPLGKLPGSVWTIPTEPLRVPDHLPQHFAAFPSEWPKRIILGWSPSGVCVACGEGRRPVTELDPAYAEYREATGDWNASLVAPGGGYDGTGNRRADGRPQSWRGTITGYACACPDTTAPTRPAVVLDPFCGTGTTVAVANALGRHGVGLDLSADYLTLARWRCQDPGLRAKVLGVDKPKPEVVGQLDLLGGAA